MNTTTNISSESSESSVFVNVNSTVTPTKEFIECVTYPGQFALILAGAGCGKTTALTHRICHILTINPEARILAVTFTKNAARTMQERLTAMLGEDLARNVNIRTIHSLGASLLRGYTQQCNRKPGYTIISPNIIKDLVGLITDDPKDQKTFIKEISVWKNHIRTPDTYNLSCMWKEYEKILVEKNLVDFDDLVQLPLAMLRSHPALARFEARKYTHLFVDEYQDTSPEQLEFLDLLTTEKTVVTCVGDDAQSIYSFRGANPKCITEFEDKYQGAKVFSLSKNYRSTQKICDIGNKSLLPNPMKYRKTLYAASGEAGEDITFIHREKIEAEAEAVIQKIREHQKNDPTESIAVIYRMHKISKTLAKKLSQYQIPYKIIGSNVSDSKLVELYFNILLTLLYVVPDENDENIVGGKVVLGEHDVNSPLELILLSAIKNVDARTTQTIVEHSDKYHLPLFRALEEAQLVDEIIVSRQKTLKKLAASLQVIAWNIRVNGFSFTTHEQIMGLIKDQMMKIFGSKPEEEDVNEELTLAHQVFGFLSSNPTVEVVRKICDEYRTEHTINTETTNNNGDSGDAHVIQLSSIHHVKGAEFDHVFIIGVSDRAFPMYFGKLEYKPLEEILEERRLFHVALTRGKKTVTISSSGERSVFLDELNNITEPAEETGLRGYVNEKNSMCDDVWDDHKPYQPYQWYQKNSYQRYYRRR